MITPDRADHWSTADGWLVGSLPESAARGPGPCILSPLTARLDPQLADMAAALPIGDINGELLAALKPTEPAAWVVAGILCNDPFRRTDDLLAELHTCKVRAVANWPSVGLLSGELAAALAHSGFTYANELALLQRAKNRGMATAALAADAEQIEQVLALRPDMLIVAPGLMPTTENEVQARADVVEALLQEALSAAKDIDVRLYLNPAFGSALDALRRLAPGLIRRA